MRRANFAAWLALIAIPATGHAQDSYGSGGATGENVLEEINFVRADPKAYAEELRDYRRLYRGNTVFFPDQQNALLTAEGVSAVDEAIRFLENQPPLPPLSHSRLLTLSAGDHVRDQGRTGAMGHVGSGDSRPGQRVVKRGGGIYVTESITYGPDDAVNVVRQLIVDDNVKGRGHRKMLFSPRWHFAGAACGPHPSFPMMCVVDIGETEDGKVYPPKTSD